MLGLGQRVAARANKIVNNVFVVLKGDAGLMAAAVAVEPDTLIT